MNITPTGKMKKGPNEKSVDAKASKDAAKASKKEKEARDAEDADWRAAGEGDCRMHAALDGRPVALPLSPMPGVWRCAEAHRGDSSAIASCTLKQPCGVSDDCCKEILATNGWSDDVPVAHELWPLHAAAGDVVTVHLGRTQAS